MLKGGKVRADHAIQAEELDAVYRASMRQYLNMPGPFDGLMIDTLDNAARITMLPELVNPGHIRQAFLGKIVTQGPEDEPDFEDCRYWVREVVHDNPSENPGPWDRMNLIPEGNRWVAAHNLAEYNANSPDDDSHSLVFGDTPLVWVQLTVDPMSRYQRWYFTRQAIAGIRYGVVRRITNTEGRTLWVQGVQEDENGQEQFVGDIVELAVWSKTKAGWYWPFVWPPGDEGGSDTVEMETSVLPVLYVDGAWRVFQYFKEAPPELPAFPGATTWPMSDCNPWRT